MLRVCFTDEDQIASLNDLDDIKSSEEVLSNLRAMLEGIAESLGLNDMKQVQEKVNMHFT